MQLSNMLDSLGSQLQQLPQQKIAQVVTLGFIVYTGYLLSQITWGSVAQPTAFVAPGTKTNSYNQASSREQLNLQTLKALNLFGLYTENKEPEAVEVVESAPETRLNISLSGLVASDDPSVAAAIITSSGAQETYGVGEKIKGTRATLERVLPDRVLIKQSGKLETLMLDGFDYETSASSNNSSARASSTQSRGVSNARTMPNNREIGPSVRTQSSDAFRASAQSLRDDLKDDPGKISDYLKISPKKENGEIIGYLLRPGKNRDFFNEAGLKSGDIATSVNGLDLTNPMEAAEALRQIRSESQIALMVRRGEELTEVLLSVD
ncbi:type II secretion system protein GspC [Thalassotalea agarivorans]|uniref:Type II secretion system protein C (GspC) n=1 Tax=Thalassotalea agarivorans TaxID=349064 RepID=A0A1I0E5X1_THASX|nr:type II secretion system protein GspC [Thalassotalea agarivorans]SET39648.1 type II secretion system protein C (GspC) [Thalassotalea agarivorans]